MGNWIARQNKSLLLALAIGLAYHGSLLFFTFKRTYDAYVHIFFGDHYARAWFDHWEYRWYTGFTMTSYPPGSHQTIALLSKFVGLQNAFIIAQTCAILIFIIGVYRFSRIWVSDEAAGYAALLTVFSSSITETLHVFGQLPTTFSLCVLLNALPFVYRWLRDGQLRYLFIAWSLNAATTAGHHVTTLFGAVFFVAPIMALALAERLIQPLPDEPSKKPRKVTRKNLKPLLYRYVRRVLPMVWRTFVYGIGMIMLLVIVVLPYWLWSSSDPITQVPIPHSSRDSFIENVPAGIVFWLVPYGLTLIALPYAFARGLTKKTWPLTLSLILLFVLGTGGTTPIPRFILRGAFDILTLDRFTFWATITVLPLLGDFVVSLRRKSIANYLRTQFGDSTWMITQVVLVVGYIGFSVFTANLTQFRKFQPDPIDIDPIVSFINKDQHWRWRYLTLGFGDQVAWLSANTTANSVEGNYHSARRLPELTTTSIERLDGAKFRGIPGIGSLQQFLTVPEKYNLKFVFSTDQFYDPLLYFSGWHQIGRLENGVIVWEREDIPPLPEVLPRKEIPIWQRLMWGILPLTAISLAIIAVTFHTMQDVRGRIPKLPPLNEQEIRLPDRLNHFLWTRSGFPELDESEPVMVQKWVDRLRQLRYPTPAAPSAKMVRSLAVLLSAVIALTLLYREYDSRATSPEAIMLAYYDDLDFRRFNDAHARLNPLTRANFDKYLLDLSVDGGFLASYAKLDALETIIIKEETDRLEVEAHTAWVTSLSTYETVQTHTFSRIDGDWYIEPNPVDISVPPDQFFRRPIIAWGSQGRRQASTETTSFADVQDRPKLEILSARLVEIGDRVSVVGELINTDADPGDVTVTSLLYAEDGFTLSKYNAQDAILHKLLPKEVTPFRIDFEGVAGTNLGKFASVEVAELEAKKNHDDENAFAPDAFTAPTINEIIDSFEVYGKAVVTGRDLDREVGAQNISFETDGNTVYLLGELINAGTEEAVIPHVLITYYNEANHVVWVDEFYIEASVRPQRTRALRLPLTQENQVTTIIDKGDSYTNALGNEVLADVADGVHYLDQISTPNVLGYDSLRISVNYFKGAE